MAERMTISSAHQEILEARGLDVELISRLGVTSSTKLGGDCIAIPYYRGETMVGTKYRTLGEEKRFLQERGSEQILYNRNCLDDETLAEMPVIICEGELDTLSAIQAGFLRSVSVPGGAPSVAVGDRAAAKYDFLEDMPQIAERVPIILATDGDEPGAALRADLALRLGPKRCKWVKYPKGCKDLNDVLRLYGERGVVVTINRADWIVGNVYRMSGIPMVPEAHAHDSWFPGLADHYKLRLGDFCVVSGIPGHGKTAFVDDLACRMAFHHRWPVCIASFEQAPRDLRRLMRSWFGGGMENSLDTETVEKADKWIEEMFSFIVADNDSSPTLTWVMERMAASALRYGTRLFVIDPWNELEHERPLGLTLTEYVGASIRELKAFARRYEAHVIVVAHPRIMRRDDKGNYPIPSLYDISDSSHWANKPDVGIVIHREKDSDSTLVRVAKSRYHDKIGKPGDIYAKYVWQRATYEPTVTTPETPRGDTW